MTKKVLFLLCFVCYRVGQIVHQANRPHNGNFYLKNKVPVCAWPTLLSFEEKIDSIAKKVAGWQEPTELFRSKDFEIIYRYPLAYKSYVKQLLANPAIALDHKKIALYGMEQLHLKDYLDIVTHCNQLYKNGSIPLDLLELCIAYRLAGDHPIVKNYHSPEVIALLSSIMAEYMLPHTLYKYIAAIQKGTTWKAWQEERLGKDFHWPKHPLPFKKTVDDILNQSYYCRNYTLEGHIRGTAFMMLYEHPDCYIEDAYQLIENPLPEPQVGLVGIKYSFNGLRNEIVCNALRKLPQAYFLCFLKKLYTVDPNHRLIKSTAGSYYDTLLLKPYPLPVHLKPEQMPPLQEKLGHNVFASKIEHYHQLQQEQDKLRLLYKIPSFSTEKSFYYFDGA
ncbi:MAG: hypothetical protein K2X94_04810 [Amoebophilaceae bacterium]|nr:hypothetical protein [Amoebophilaceae bacterium]